MKAKLLVTKGDTHVREVRLKPTTTIGRGRDCDLCIHSSLVSRDHCVISEHQGALRVKDLGSTNGTFVNGEAVTEKVLRPGDSLTIGPLSFKVQYDAPHAVAVGSGGQGVSPAIEILEEEAEAVDAEIVDADVVDDTEEVLEAVPVDQSGGHEDDIVEAMPVEDAEDTGAAKRPAPVVDDDDDDEFGDFLARLRGNT